MKIQNQSSVLSTGVWKISEMSQVQETQKALPVAQTESTATLPLEAQRNQRLSEFKTQEQLVRANLQNQLPSSIKSEGILNGKSLDKQMGGDWEDHNTIPEMDRAIEALVRIKSEILRTGHSGSLDAQYLPRIEELLEKLEARRDATLALITASLPIERGNEGTTSNARPSIVPGNDRDRPESGGLTGHGPENDTAPRRSQQAPSATPSSVNERRGRSRRPVSNGNFGSSNNRNSGAAPRNQKSDSGPKNIDYSNSTNSSNDSYKSGTDNRNYNSGNTAPKKTDGSDYENNTHDENNDIDIVSPAGYAPGELPTLSNDPMTGHGGGSGSDIGASGRIPKGSPDNRSGIQQMVQPGVSLFSSTTGADDKERPNTGNTSGTVWNSSEGDDLGDDLPYDLKGGGSVDTEAGKALLKQIRPINPGGPDPGKR